MTIDHASSHDGPGGHFLGEHNAFPSTRLVVVIVVGGGGGVVVVVVVVVDDVAVLSFVLVDQTTSESSTKTCSL